MNSNDSGSAIVSQSVHVTMRLREFRIPPVRDCLVVGKKSPIGCVALKKAFVLMHAAEFVELHPDDDLIGSILVRGSILKKVTGDSLTQLVMKRVKPLMDGDEVVHLDISAEVVMEDQV